ncbi:MAG TPA: glycosyltransferase [Thermomicrobiaceae bacterium]|nr:glycosyltransferase [Thermomicrobiaceae bacterium]
MIGALRVRGPFRGPSGYDHHTREFVREMARQGVAVQLLELPGWGAVRLPEALRDPWFERLDRPVDARVTLHFAMPHQVVPAEGNANVDYTMFEATRVPDLWVERNREHALVVVPTTSSRDAWLASGFPGERLRVCPLGVNAALFAAPGPPLPLITEAGLPVARYRHRFLNVSELGPRKNLVGLLGAWLAATRPDDDAILLVKLGQYAPGWLDLLRRDLRALEERTRQRFADAAPVQFLFDLLADREMPRLYAAATHYVSLSHGEGWDQTMVEAAVSGLRLIAPDHSAYRDYLTPETATLIPSREVPAGFVGDPTLQALFAGANWWEPDQGAAAAAIRDAIDGRDAGRTGAGPAIARRFSWEESTRALLAILDEVAVSAAR